MRVKEHTEQSFNYAKLFISNADVITLDDKIVDKVIELKRNKIIKLPDAIIGASALLNNLTLITRNTNDFDKIGVNIYNPFK